jgi:hypothetical protein
MPAGGAANAGASGSAAPTAGDAPGGAAGSAAGSSSSAGQPSVAPASCQRPLSEWTQVAGTLVPAEAGTAAYVKGGLVVSVGDDGATELMHLGEQNPEQPGTSTPLPGVRGFMTAGAGEGRSYVLTQLFVGPQATPTPATLFSFADDGSSKSVTTGFTTVQHDGGFAALGDRVVVLARQAPGATVHIETFDMALQPRAPVDMPLHAAGALAVAADGIRLATIDNASKTLQIYALSDQAPKLLRSHALPALTIMIAWAGDSVVLWLSDKLLVIGPDDSRLELALPPFKSVSGIAYLHAAATPFGTALSIDLDNVIYIGLLRDGAVEWDGPYGAPQSVYADLRADEHSFGAYSITTAGGRSVVYSGRRCPD